LLDGAAAGCIPVFRNESKNCIVDLQQDFNSGLIEPLVRRLPVSRRNISLDFKAKKFISGAGLPPAIRNQIWLGAFSGAEALSVLGKDLRGALATTDCTLSDGSYIDYFSTTLPTGAYVFKQSSTDFDTYLFLLTADRFLVAFNDDDPLTNTRTTHTLLPVRILMWEMPYHAEHHRWPALPFHALAAAHESLGPRLAHVARHGYLGFHLVLLKSLAKTDAPDGGAIR